MRRIRSVLALACALGASTLVLVCPAVVFAGTAVTSAAATSASTLPFTVGTPQLAQITSTASAQPPWNEYQGDPAFGQYTSNGVGTLYPTYTPGGVTTNTGGVTEPNIAVYPGATSGTDGNVPYPAGTVGTPGTLDGYCGTGAQAEETSASPVRQPAGTTLPLAPDYFPHIVENADGTLTGYFDYRPKDADEAIIAATSTDNGRTWTYDGEALEENPGYCPSADTTDDGEGHPNVLTIGGNTYFYTLPRAAGDMQGVGMIVHQFSPTEADPLAGLPATESVGIDPDAFVPAGTATISITNGTPETIPLTTLGTPDSPEQLIVGSFVDLTQTPGTPTVITCTGLGASSLTGCTTASGDSVNVQPGDLIEQVLGFTTKSSDIGTVPAGPNTTTGDDSTLASLTVDPVAATVPADGYTANQFANPLTGTMFNNDAPMRLYINGTAIYCTNANANPTDHIEDCTAGSGNPAFDISSPWEPITGDPIVPATAYDTAQGDGMTTGLVAPDGIVGTLPSYPETSPGAVPAGATYVMYTEKELGYYDAAETTAAGTVESAPSTFSIASTPGPYISADLASFGSAGPWTVALGVTTSAGTTAIVPVTCTGLNESTGAFSGCTVPSADSGDTFASNSYLAAPGAALVSPSTLGEIGEGSSTNVSKLYKNNEDLTVLQVAWTTNGVDFSTTGLANGGVISGENNCGTASADPVCSSSSDAGLSSPYDDINNPAETVSPSNLNAYADNDAANSTGPATGGTDTGGTPDADEMRWVGSAGSIIDNNGTYELFLSGSWAADGDSDSFNQVFYSTSTNGEYWTVPTPVISTDYSFAASATQDSELADGADDPLGISAYYSGRAYAPSVVQNPDGTLTMVFGGDRIPKSLADAGTTIGTNPSAQYTIGATDPAIYRNILVVTLQPASAPAQPTTTSLVSTVSPSTSVGDQVSFTATVTPISPYAGPPTGTVSFATTGGVISGCSAVPLSQLTPDTATCTTTYTGPADNSVQAVYSGDSLFAGSSNYTSTTTTLTSSDGGTAVAGETVTYSAAVADVGASAPAPTGTVTFTDSAGLVSNCSDQTLSVQGSELVAQCSVLYPTALSSPDTVTATYNGDAATFGSAGTLTESVGQASTTTSVTSSDNGTAVAGETVTYTASVGVVSPGTGTPTGTIDFSDSAGAISDCSSVPLTGASAQCTVTYTAPLTAPDIITASYSGDGNYQSSSEDTFSEAVSQAATTTDLSSSSASVVVGQPVTITATIGIVSPGAGTPTGTVSFSDTAGVIGAACPSQSVSEVSGAYVATCTTSFPAAIPGGDSVSASYSGDGNFSGSQSTSAAVISVGEAHTTTTVSAVSPVVVGQPVTYQATVGVQAPGSGTPTGSVTFTGLGSGVLCAAAPLSGGSATCTTSYTSPGSPSVTATYNSDGNFASSTSAAYTEVVNQDSTVTTLTASPDPAVAGQPTTLTAAVLVSSPGVSTPTGTVNFTSGSTTLCGSVSLTSGADGETATCSATFAKVSASLSVTATYSGDANELGSSQSLSLAVAKATHLKVTASPSPAAYGHQVTLRASGLPAAAPGTILFGVSGTGVSTTPCSVTVTNGGATCLLSSPLEPGSYTVTASYQPTGTTYGPSSATAGLTVVQATTAISLKAEPKTSAYGTAIDLVSAKLPALATGALTFTVGSTTVCSAVTAAPSVTCVVPGTLAPGSYQATVTYSGDANYTGSSATTTFTVIKARPSFSIAASVSGSDVVITATLPATATGTVSFVSGSYLDCTAEAVSDGTATCTADGLAARTYHVTATYSGDAYYDSASSSLSFTVS